MKRCEVKYTDNNWSK